MLTYVVKTLDKEKINYWIDRSGLLSILRKEKFSLISDIDIGVNFASKNRVFDLFKSKKYIIDKFYSFKNKRIKLSLRSKNNLLKYEPAIIDFIFYKFEQSKAVQFGNKKSIPNQDILKI